MRAGGWAVFLTSTVAAAQPRLAVLDVAVKNLDAETGAVLTELITAEADAVGKYQVVSGADLSAMISFEQQKDLLGCEQQSCMAEIAGALGADLLLIGQVGRVGSTHVVSLKLMVPATAKVEQRFSESVSGDVDAVLEIIKRGTRAVLGGEASPVGPGPRDAPLAVVEAPAGSGVPVGPLVTTIAGMGLLGYAVYLHLRSNDEAARAGTGVVGAHLTAVSASQTRDEMAIYYAAGGAVLAGGLLWWWLSADDAPASVAMGPSFAPDSLGFTLMWML